MVMKLVILPEAPAKVLFDDGVIAWLQIYDINLEMIEKI